MALTPWKIIATMGLIPVAGICIAYPLVSKYKNKSRIELNTLQDFKKNCLALNNQLTSNQQLLTCPVAKNSSETNFYLYDKGNNGQLPQKIKGDKIEGQKITLNLEGSNSEKDIQLNGSQLNFLGNKSLLKSCKVHWQNKERSRVLICSDNKISPQLEEFK